MVSEAELVYCVWIYLIAFYLQEMKGSVELKVMLNFMTS